MSESPRYSWTQPSCNGCWDAQHPDRHPTRLLRTEDEICVFCGQPTRSGIYVRVDPREAAHPSNLKD